jgi:hypothetical protein
MSGEGGAARGDLGRSSGAVPERRQRTTPAATHSPVLDLHY